MANVFSSRRQRKLFHNKRTAIFSAVVAAVILIFGMSMLSDFLTLKKKCTQTAIGTVVDEQRVRVNGGKHTRIRYVAEVAYTDGVSEYTCRSGKRRTRFYINSELTVRYNPENPAECYIEEAKPDTGIDLILAALIIEGVSVYTLIRQKKEKQEEQTDYDGFDFR